MLPDYMTFCSRLLRKGEGRMENNAEKTKYMNIEQKIKQDNGNIGRNICKIWKENYPGYIEYILR